MPPTTQIRIRRDTAANFTSANPTLALGEIAYETDTFRFKVGTGSTAWTALGYAAQNPTSLTVTDSTASTSTTTGALRVTGGVGIGGALYTGGNAVVGGSAVVIGPNLLAVGENAGTGSSGTRLGVLAGGANSTGIANTCLGRQAGRFTTTGSNNTSVGAFALENNVTGGANVAVGWRALDRNLASDIVGVGTSALAGNTLGTANVAVGRSALGAATTSAATVTISAPGSGGTPGTYSGVQLTYVSGATAVTYPTADIVVDAGGTVTSVTIVSGGTGFTATSGTVMTAAAASIGNTTGFTCTLATVSTAASNTAVGHQAGLTLTTATNCTLVGAGAGDAITSAASVTAVGRNALGSLTTGSLNTAVGADSLLNVVTGVQNTALGWSAGQALTTSDAVCIGTRALLNATTATQSVAVGSAAGRYRGSGTDSLTSATNSIFIGHGSRANGDSQANQVVIAGIDGLGDGSNTTVIGNSSTTSTRIPAGNLTLSSGQYNATNSGNAIQGMSLTTTGTAGSSGAGINFTNDVSNIASVGLRSSTTGGGSGFPNTLDIRQGVQGTASGGGIALIAASTGGNIDFYCGGTAVATSRHARITNAGNLSLDRGNLVLSAGAGIDFSADANAAGMTSELLDDYEEGTWTPGIEFGGASVALTFSVRSATYTKIGRQVTVAARVNLSNKGTSIGDAIITGLPFTSLSTGSVAYAPSFRYENITAVNHLTGFLGSNGTTINLNETNDAGAISAITDADFANNSGFLLTATYFTA